MCGPLVTVTPLCGAYLSPVESVQKMAAPGLAVWLCRPNFTENKEPNALPQSEPNSFHYSDPRYGQRREMTNILC
jgi:hypothetical protein